MTQFPNTCCRCGFCCLMEVCPNGMLAFNIQNRKQPCPGIRFDEQSGEAICQPFKDSVQIGIHESIAKDMFGIDKGCCISAKAIKDGVAYYFASLVPGQKKTIVAMVRKTVSINERG